MITFPPLMTLSFDLLTSKLLCQFLLTWVTSALNLNAVWFSVFELTVGTRQTDGRTVTRNAASYRGWPHNNSENTQFHAHVHA